jgi:predicted transcriptional regulator
LDWNKYGRVLASKHRTSVIRVLSNTNTTPKEISLAAKIPLSHVSNLLRELTEEGLVVCLTPKLRRGRIYTLTAAGKNVASELARHPPESKD